MRCYVKERNMSDEIRQERGGQTTDGKRECKCDRRNIKGRRRLHDMGGVGTDMKLQSALNRCSARPLTECDDIRYCKNTILTSLRRA
jgi:hypothetical protein